MAFRSASGGKRVMLPWHEEGGLRAGRCRRSYKQPKREKKKEKKTGNRNRRVCVCVCVCVTDGAEREKGVKREEGRCVHAAELSYG
ncbi:hypothetical protein LY76DRAFT_117482 [Colletotrichum caudatum]|nr:hypothetical protein LY76DRAFT_117482 [Colletotrichum caudatum]